MSRRGRAGSGRGRWGREGPRRGAGRSGSRAGAGGAGGDPAGGGGGGGGGWSVPGGGVVAGDQVVGCVVGDVRFGPPVGLGDLVGRFCGEVAVAAGAAVGGGLSGAGQPEIRTAEGRG